MSFPIEQDSDEIIAIQIGKDVYFGQLAIDKVKEINGFTKLYSRWVFKFMAHMDLDERWAEYAAYPTIFKISEYERFLRDEFKE